MKENKINIYLISVILFMLVLPAIFIALDPSLSDRHISRLLAGKWIIFWAIGVRLFIAGIRQALNPSFTAQKIFRISGTDSFPVIRELGFANICIGMFAMLSLWHPEWRTPAGLLLDL
jgi:hypothetical protein